MKQIDELLTDALVIDGETVDGANTAKRIGAFIQGLLMLFAAPWSSKQPYPTGAVVIYRQKVYQAVAPTKKGQDPLAFKGLWGSAEVTSVEQIDVQADNRLVGAVFLAEYVKQELNKITLGGVPSIDSVAQVGAVTDAIFDFGGLRVKKLDTVTKATSFVVPQIDADGKIKLVQIGLSDVKALLGTTTTPTTPTNPVETTKKYKILRVEVAVDDIAEKKPNAPSALKIVEYEPNKYRAQLADNSDNEVGFEIERSVNGNAFDVWRTLAANETQTAELTDFDKTANHTIRARAYNKIGFSDYSNAFVFTGVVGSNVFPPQAPNVPDKTAKVGQAYTFQLPLFAYANPDNLVLTCAPLPTGFTFDATTRTVSGSCPVLANVKVYYKAVDPTNQKAETSFIFKVEREKAVVQEVKALVGVYAEDSGVSHRNVLFIYATPTLDDTMQMQILNGAGQVVTDWFDMSETFQGKNTYMVGPYETYEVPANTILHFNVRPKSNPTAVSGKYQAVYGGEINYFATLQVI